MGTLDTTRSVGTDVAAWFLFHPDDLAHRADDPLDWWAHDFAVAREFLAGTLVAVETGADGGYTVRLTDGGLSPREETYALAARVFRLRVRHGRLYVDGGDGLPYEGRLDNPEDYPDRWITLADGAYQVTVHVLAWDEEPGALAAGGQSAADALPSYVAVFAPVPDLDAIAPLTALPRLERWAPTPRDAPAAPEPAAPVAPTRWARAASALRGRFRRADAAARYLVFPRDAVVFPETGSLDPPISADDNAALSRAGGPVVLVLSPAAGAIGTLFATMSYGSSITSDAAGAGYDMSGRGVRRVRLLAVEERQGARYARVAAYEPPATEVDPARLAEVRRLFARYAEADAGYRRRIHHHRFYAERVASLTDARAIGWSVAHALDLPPDVQYELLTASDAALIDRLPALLAAADGT